MPIIDFVGALLECLLIWYFCDNILKTRKYSSTITYAGFLVLVLIYYGCAIFISPVNEMVVLLKGVILFIALVIPSALYQGRMLNNFLLNCVFLAFQMGIEYVVSSVFVWLYHITTFPAPDEFYVMGLFLTRIITFILTYVLVVCLEKKIMHECELSYKYIFLFLLLSASSSIIIWAIFDMVISSNIQVDFWKYLIPNVLLVGANISVFYLMQTISRAEKERFILLQFERLQKDFENYYSSIGKKNEQILKIQHDMYNYLVNIYSLLENGDTEVAKEEVREEIKFVNSQKEIMTANSFLNTVLQIKKEQATKHDIYVEYAVRIPKYLDVKWTKIALAISIAFDNAIEAACKLEEKDKRYIRLNMYINHNHLVVSMENTIKGKVDITSEGLVLSTKPDKDKHGYGLGNIERLLNEVDGEMFLTCDENIFKLKAVIPIQNAGGEIDGMAG